MRKEEEMGAPSLLGAAQLTTFIPSEPTHKKTLQSTRLAKIQCVLVLSPLFLGPFFLSLPAFFFFEFSTDRAWHRRVGTPIETDIKKKNVDPRLHSSLSVRNKVVHRWGAAGLPSLLEHLRFLTRGPHTMSKK